MPKQRSFAVLILIIACLTFLSSGLGSFFAPRPSLAQQVKPQDVWRQVYQQLPDLPLENQYISRANGKPATENTLVARLIRYHLYVKGRPPIYRLDWKLTIADYLGANDLMEENVYPGYDSLRSNPMEGDRAAIERLNRSQRDALVNVIVTIFNPNAAAPPQVAPTPNATPPSPPTSNPNPPLRLPQPGDARLLIP